PIWSQGPQLPRRFARLLLEQGHPALALEVASSNLDSTAYPNDLELLYCRALALARIGIPTSAERCIQELLERTDLPPAVHSDALSLAGRIRKDQAAQSTDQADRCVLFRQAFDYYNRAFDLAGDTFPGINAASLALLAGDEQAHTIASTVRDAVLAQLDKPGKESDYWLQATRGEACLLLGEYDAARA